MRNVMRMMAVLWCVLACLSSGQAQAEKRVALVIGNGSYANIAALPNVPNDASGIREQGMLGFLRVRQSPKSRSAQRTVTTNA